MIQSRCSVCNRYSTAATREGGSKGNKGGKEVREVGREARRIRVRQSGKEGGVGR